MELESKIRLKINFMGIPSKSGVAEWVICNGVARFREEERRFESPCGKLFRWFFLGGGGSNRIQYQKFLRENILKNARKNVIQVV